MPSTPVLETVSYSKIHFPGQAHWSTCSLVYFEEGSLAPEEAAFLAAKGSLSIPQREDLDEFVRQYFLYIQPALPLLPESAFWISYNDPVGRSGKVPLVLLHALLFASCPYVQNDTLLRCGFIGKADAGRCFYNRAKALFNLLPEASLLAQAQAAILLSHHASVNEPQAGSEWLGRAIQAAQLLDDPLTPGQAVDVSLKKRLWWSIILRDRSLCLALNRRCQVTAIPTDLGIESFNDADLASEMMDSHAFTLPSKRELLTMLKEHYGLAIALSDMMQLVYTSHGAAGTSLTQCAPEDIFATVRQIEERLTQWKASTKRRSLTGNQGTPIVNRFANMVNMYYYAARIRLSQFELLLLECHPEYRRRHAEMLDRIRNNLQDSIQQQILILQFFGQYARHHTLPLAVVGCLPMPLTLMAINISLSQSQHQAVLYNHQFTTIKRVINSLEHVYEGAAMIAQGLSHFFRLAHQAIQLRGAFQDNSESLDPTSVPDHQSRPASVLSYASPTTRDPHPWVEFLLQSPRAYLLISTSVDHSMATGRLPLSACLPPVLTYLQPGLLRISLPWEQSPAREVPSPEPLLPKARSRLTKGKDDPFSRTPTPQHQIPVNINYLDLGSSR
ncbi:hypothetical protein BJX65DRAFT_320514 [Aspergillus insuetus]